MCNYIAPAFDQYQNQNTIRSQSKGAAYTLHFIIHGNTHSHSWPSLSVCICRTSTTDSASTQFPTRRRFISSAGFSSFLSHDHVYCNSSSLGARRHAEVYRQGRCLAFDPTLWRGAAVDPSEMYVCRYQAVHGIFVGFMPTSKQSVSRSCAVCMIAPREVSENSAARPYAQKRTRPVVR